MKKCFVLIAIALVCLALAPFASADDPKGHFSVHPKTFVGKAGDCGTGYPAGSEIVTAAWIQGIGLPDNGGANSNPSNHADNLNKNDDRNGLLLSKNGATADCSAAGADITGADGAVLTELGFDIRNGTHCGGGAPRFNVDASDGFHFVGNCSAPFANATPAPQDPTAWTRLRFDLTQANPPVTPGAKIKSISIIFDEGTDGGPGAGLAVIDNVDVNGVLAVKQ
ncbi:MAG TPA: hypothetical protein VEU96_02035 [Bryobacteraceae bacterium]|nr:hypothetical protein [Bryobacteraceae bacterium]